MGRSCSDLPAGSLPCADATVPSSASPDQGQHAGAVTWPLPKAMHDIGACAVAPTLHHDSLPLVSLKTVIAAWCCSAACSLPLSICCPVLQRVPSQHDTHRRAGGVPHLQQEAHAAGHGELGCQPQQPDSAWWKTITMSAIARPGFHRVRHCTGAGLWAVPQCVSKQCQHAPHRV